MVSKALHVLTSGDSNNTERRWKGVRKRTWGRYVCEIRLPRSRQRIWLGSYATAEEAACAYDAACLCLRGTTASLNFPSSISFPLLSRDSSSNLSREEIQSIAAMAAARCRNADKLPELPISSDIDQPHKWASPALPGPYSPNQSEESSHWAVRMQFRTKPQVDSEQLENGTQVQVSSTEEIGVPASAAEDEQCVFSILKELVALPTISNAYGAPMF